MQLFVVFLLVAIAALTVRHAFLARHLRACENDLQGVRKHWELDRDELNRLRIALNSCEEKLDLERDELTRLRIALAEFEARQTREVEDD